MTITAIAHDREPLDALVWRTIGRGPDAVEHVLDANPGLGGLGPFLPEGHVVLIPELASAPAEADLVQLWS